MRIILEASLHFCITHHPWLPKFVLPFPDPQLWFHIWIFYSVLYWIFLSALLLLILALSPFLCEPACRVSFCFPYVCFSSGWLPGPFCPLGVVIGTLPRALLFPFLLCSLHPPAPSRPPFNLNPRWDKLSSSDDEAFKMLESKLLEEVSQSRSQ